MSNIVLFEVFLIIGICAVQALIFSRTLIKIRSFRNVIPEIDDLKIVDVLIPRDDLDRLHPSDILSNIDRYKNQVKPENPETEDTEEFDQSIDSESQPENTMVNIIESTGLENDVSNNIIYSINNYLIRNRGASSDFNLIKDIVERHSNAAEEDINLTISVPLYLGLMGTMLGIVIALFAMPGIGIDMDTTQTSRMLDEGISTLIGGVKIAMIASFFGLLLTIFNSGWAFKGSRQKNEAKKNAFYTLMQVELLPIINQGLAATLDSLQRNLLRFNNEFSANLTELTSVFDSNKAAMKIQKELIESLNRTKIAEMARYNVKVLQQLDLSIVKFERFNSYLGNVNQFIEHSQHIVERTDALLDRTAAIENIGGKIDSKLDQSQQLLDFLSRHFYLLEEKKEIAQHTVVGVASEISKAFEELKTHIEKSSEVVKEFTIKESEILKSALSESRTNLTNLEYLADLKTDVSEFKSNTETQRASLNDSVDRLNNSMMKSISILEQLEQKEIKVGDVNVKMKLPSFRSLFKSSKK